MGIALSIIGILATAAFAVYAYFEAQGRKEAAFWSFVAGLALSGVAILLGIMYVGRNWYGRRSRRQSGASTPTPKADVTVPRKPFDAVSVPGSGLSEEEIYVLRALSHPKCGETHENKVASFLGLNPARVKFYLTELQSKGYVHVLVTYVGTNKADYGLTQKARTFLVENDLV